jgi:hypothetical protein
MIPGKQARPQDSISAKSECKVGCGVAAFPAWMTGVSCTEMGERKGTARGTAVTPSGRPQANKTFFVTYLLLGFR